MPVSHPEFTETTEASTVAAAFADRIRGRTILITGVNLKGVGYATAHAFVRLLYPLFTGIANLTTQASQSPARIIIAGRSLARMQESITALRASFPDVDYRPLVLELSDQASVRKAAAELISWQDVPAIDIQVNNAAVMLLPERTLTPEGIEMHFATNHVGHFLLTCLVMPKLLASSLPARIVNVSSASPKSTSIRWSDQTFLKPSRALPPDERPNYDIHRAWGLEKPEDATYIPLEGYGQSKAANVLCSIALNARLRKRHGVASFAVHPGIIRTELSRNATKETLESIEKLLGSGAHTIKTQEQGASTSMVAALDPALPSVLDEGAAGNVKGNDQGLENWGVYLADCQVNGQLKPLSSKSAEAERLWAVSEELVGRNLRFEALRDVYEKTSRIHTVSGADERAS
ncbi:hypothetical protein MRB53_036876 [Persea americana]|nr:hypothetical protein MRB53_036876 [Persea americana]